MYPILSIDGGGVRGIYAARLIERLEAEAPFLGNVKLFAGTSTGAIIALGLAAGWPPSRLTKLYEEHSQAIFARSFLRRLLRGWGLWRAKHDQQALKKILSKEFGEMRLGDLPGRVLVPAFDLDNDPRRPRHWKPKFFHNYPGSGSDEGELVVDVALRSSAAPTYFPSYQNFVDGGLSANDPSMAAVAQVLHEGEQLADLRVLSVSTGYNPRHIPGDVRWGLTGWAKKLVDLMIDGTMGIARYQCEQLLRDNFYKILDPLPATVNLDDAARVGDLLTWANAVDTRAAVVFIKHKMQAPADASAVAGLVS